jgi:hypothetical protein
MSRILLRCLALCGLALASACEGGGSCPDISAGTVTPGVLQTSFERLSATEKPVQLVVADDGLYWRDSWSVYALREGQTAAGFRSILGAQILGGDAGHVYLATSDGLVAIATR